MDWTIFGPFLGPFFFLDHFIGGKHTISSQGGVGCGLSVLREGWEAECYYSGGVRDRLLLRREGWEAVVIVNTTS